MVFFQSRRRDFFFNCFGSRIQKERLSTKRERSEEGLVQHTQLVVDGCLLTGADSMREEEKEGRRILLDNFKFFWWIFFFMNILYVWNSYPMTAMVLLSRWRMSFKKRSFYRFTSKSVRQWSNYSTLYPIRSDNFFYNTFSLNIHLNYHF